MRPDIAALAEEVERERQQRAIEAYKPLLVDPLRESRLLVNLIVNHDVLALCEDLEVDDFTDFRHIEIFRVVRRLQYQEGDPSFHDVLDALDERCFAYLVDVFFKRSLFIGERCARECKEHLQRLSQRRRDL